MVTVMVLEFFLRVREIKLYFYIRKLILAISKVVAVWILVSCGKYFSSSAGDSICCLHNLIDNS